MNDETATFVRCNEPMVIESPRCTLPRGHAGRHETNEIPEPLSAAVASAMIAHDEAISAHEEAQGMMGEVRVMRATAKRRITGYWIGLLCFFFGNVLFTIVNLIGAWQLIN